MADDVEQLPELVAAGALDLLMAGGTRIERRAAGTGEGHVLVRSAPRSVLRIFGRHAVVARVALGASPGISAVRSRAGGMGRVPQSGATAGLAHARLPRAPCNNRGVLGP